MMLLFVQSSMTPKRVVGLNFFRWIPLSVIYVSLERQKVAQSQVFRLTVNGVKLRHNCLWSITSSSQIKSLTLKRWFSHLDEEWSDPVTSSDDVIFHFQRDPSFNLSKERKQEIALFWIPSNVGEKRKNELGIFNYLNINWTSSNKTFIGFEQKNMGKL